MGKFKANEDFKKRRDLLDKYGDNARLLYALELRYGLEDIDSVAVEALTDEGDDQKCDLLYINEDEGYAVIAQAYEARTMVKGDLAPSHELAKENKAADLNTAIAWIFDDKKVSFIPSTLKSAIISFQENLENDNINNIYLWYVHNFDEDRNPKVRKQLEKVKDTTLAYLNTKYPKKNVNVEFVEVGINQLEKWYENSNKRIVIEDKLFIKVQDGFTIKGIHWEAFVTAVEGSWIKDIYLKYDKDLFSGNPRDYLGSQTKKLSINSGIRTTIEKDHDNFWPFNNGITALVNSFDFNEKTKKLTLKGMTIINGAQTTGAIASMDFKNVFYVPIRFITCKVNSIIDSIILNNNKQNEILTSDMRSNDSFQTRLRYEFSKYPKLFYSGGRRSDKKIDKEITQFDNYLVGQLLHAFHFDAHTAYNKRKYLWQEDNYYNAIFKDSLTPEHVIFLYSLSKAIDDYKFGLKLKGEGRIDKEEGIYSFFRMRGAKMLLVSAVSKCMDTILSRKIKDKFSLRFKDCTDFNNCVNLWNQLLKTIIGFYEHLQNGLDDGLKNRENIDKAIAAYSDYVYSIKESLGDRFAERFIKAVAK
ncbi:MAG: AIPR family protein [Christensenellaceae bacterium]|jgi:hypothetical protein|nr:AIPR family protein [Christensenellaceae bacterium]